MLKAISKRRLYMATRAFLAIVLVSSGANAVSAAENDAEAQVARKIRETVEKIVLELTKDCPIGDPSDQSAFDRCRKSLFDDSALKQTLSPIVLWGRQSPDPNATLKETNLTQLSSEIVAGLYMPLFMFNGKFDLKYSPTEKLYLSVVGVGFRNRLPPGDFPYPFWQLPKKWTDYENATALYVWVNPANRHVVSIEVSPHGEQVGGAPTAPNGRPAFDGLWMWTDEAGKTQPVVTLFDGLFDDKNPYKADLEQSYRRFATSLREGQCLSCHVPSNPYGMKRLVLLQSPAHAAAEIKRILRNVREHRMPLDELTGIETPLDPQLERTLLEQGAAFETIVDAARSWEKASH